MSHRQPLWVVRQSEGKGRRTGEEGERSLVPFLACPWHSCFFVRDPFSSARNQSQGSGIIGFCERAMIIGALFFGSFYPWSFTWWFVLELPERCCCVIIQLDAHISDINDILVRKNTHALQLRSVQHWLA
uniref:Uncharacterized protein n=1 Tax=Physcomitrium patens TaxID=3218 RepID=A0A2K1IGB4_PHYPA|nr:hypothetical protein PHYPA_028906 [Physcomitrium patens]